MKLTGVAVDCLNRRYTSTSLHGIATQTTVVLIFVNTLIFVVIFVIQSGTNLNKKDTAMCDDFVTACIGVSVCCVYGNSIIFYLLNEIYFTSYRLCVYIYIGVFIYLSLNVKNYFSVKITNT